MWGWRKWRGVKNARGFRGEWWRVNSGVEDVWFYSFVQEREWVWGWVMECRSRRDSGGEEKRVRVKNVKSEEWGEEWWEWLIWFSNELFCSWCPFKEYCTKQALVCPHISQRNVLHLLFDIYLFHFPGVSKKWTKRYFQQKDSKLIIYAVCYEFDI